MSVQATDHPEHLQVTCDGCRSAFIYAKASSELDALQYITARRWSVVTAGPDDVLTICPTCTRHRRDINGMTRSKEKTQ
jgi:hypothetical protein